MTTDQETNDALLRRLIDASPIGSFVVQDGKFCYANAHFLRSMGVVESTLVGLTTKSFIHPDDEEAVEACASEMLKGKRSLPYEYRLMTSRGDTRWIVETVASVQYQGARAVFGSSNDITEEKQMEERLNLLQSITVQISEAPDVEASLKQALSSIRKFTGWKIGEAWLVAGDELVYSASSSSSEPEVRQFITASRGMRLGKGEGVPGSVWRDKEPTWIEDVSTSEIFNRKETALEAGLKTGIAMPVVVTNEVIGVLMFFLDDHAKDNLHLLDLISALTTQLGSVIRQKQVQDALRDSEKQLRDTAADLAQKNGDLEAFTYSISHDLKEPLRALEGFSQYLINNYADKLDDRGQNLLQRITNASLRMKRLIDDLLGLSRAARGSIPVEVINLDATLAEVLEGLGPRIEERGATVEIGKLPSVMADRPRMHQILHNLVTNGIKFNTSDKPKVEIGVESTDDAFVTFYVKDNGIGIAPEYHDKIFGLFQRLHTQDEFEGNGAGLAIVKRAIEALGGQLRLESEAGEGSTFFVTLPLAIEEKEEATAAALAA